MKKTIMLVALLSLGAGLVHAQRVRGYTKKDGTYVEPYSRSTRDSNPRNNYSYPGNTNPYTGKTATGDSENYQKQSSPYAYPSRAGRSRR